MGLLMLAMAMFLKSDQPQEMPQPTIERPQFVLDEVSAQRTTPRGEVIEGAIGTAKFVTAAALNDPNRSAIYTGFEMFMGEALPNTDSKEAREARERSYAAIMYGMTANDVLERVPHLEKEGGFEKETEDVRKIYAEMKENLIQILRDQNREDLIPFVDEFEHECKVLLEATQGLEGATFDFAIEQKEIANIIFEHLSAALILGNNPMAVDIGHEVQSYEDLRTKYALYLNPPTELTRVQRGLLAMHYLAMHAQAWDDNAGKYADTRFGILNPATQMLAEGKSPEEIEWTMGELAENYRLQTEALNVHPLISTIIGDGIKGVMPLADDAYRVGWNRRDNPLQAMRIAMADRGYYDPL